MSLQFPSGNTQNKVNKILLLTENQCFHDCFLAVAFYDSYNVQYVCLGVALCKRHLKHSLKHRRK